MSRLSARGRNKPERDGSRAPKQSRCYNEAVIQHYRECVKDVMLGRIVMFGADTDFEHIAQCLSEDLDIDIRKATELLWPVSHSIYAAAANTQSTGQSAQFQTNRTKVLPRFEHVRRVQTLHR